MPPLLDALQTKWKCVPTTQSACVCVRRPFAFAFDMWRLFLAAKAQWKLVGENCPKKKQQRLQIIMELMIVLSIILLAWIMLMRRISCDTHVESFLCFKFKLKIKRALELMSGKTQIAKAPSVFQLRKLLWWSSYYCYPFLSLALHISIVINWVEPEKVLTNL